MKISVLYTAFACGAVACASVANGAPVASLLVVDNQRPVDEWVYVERDGAKGRRIGRVGALTVDTLVLYNSDAVPGSELQFIAIAFGASNVDVSDPITAARGVVYHWQLAPGRGANFITQRAE